ncbi:hypothetical protein CAPTEDRAFT_193661 [Capitella teleta]|uniref:Uncharacterized protein n=1 Tax=Capitella teleta TaxID=283909 RepID=R7T9D7_CAPTE|nr:hypothetical protein CAPTEDRAFT_193661 [Capitella teleta]|eukprot:ELT90137.1 hypothetical protein CAPTEDRAFT_193661 [Capitella teleta]
MAVILDPVLAYVAVSQQTSSNDYIANTVNEFYSTEEIVAARDVLWQQVKDEVMPKVSRRQSVDTMRGSMLTINDIIKAIKILDSADKLPLFAVPYDKLRRIPMSRPSETATVSICERLLEARLESQEALIASNSAKISAVSVTSSPRPVAQSYAAAAAAANVVTNAANAPSESASSAARTASPRQPNWPNADASRLPHHQVTLQKDDQDGFQQVQPRKRRIHKFVTGTKSGERCKSFTGGPEPSRDLFLFRDDRDSQAHRQVVHEYHDNIVNACIRAAEATIPHTKRRGRAGWKRHAEPQKKNEEMLLCRHDDMKSNARRKRDFKPLKFNVSRN